MIKKERNRKTESEVQLDLFLSPRELINKKDSRELLSKALLSETLEIKNA
jgi:hypothetical protein